MWKPHIFLPLLFICTIERTSSTFADHRGIDIIGPKIHNLGEQGVENGDEVVSGKSADLETSFMGAWKLDCQNVGVSAMQLQLMPTGKVVWFDSTNLGPSAILNNPPFCLHNTATGKDCYAHALEYDPDTSKFKTMKLLYDTWCSSGGLASNGDLIVSGGAIEAEKAIRILPSCEDFCNFEENRVAFAENRWYSSQQILPDGNLIVVGGRNSFSYEVFPPSQLNFKSKAIPLPFLQETRDEAENNLYPFVYLLPDGNIFIFANSKSIILNYKTNEIVRKLPELKGGSRNYPPSAMSALLPFKLSPDNNENIPAEVIVCGGNTPDSYRQAEKGNFLPALNDCNRLVVTDENAQWDREEMPSPRTMGDMIILPNGDLFIHGGAKKGCSGWYFGDEANLTPILYSPDKPKGQRMKELAPTTIPRMYHSASALLPDTTILAAGSNPNQFYNSTHKYGTELRVEKFSPPYLAPELKKYRPELVKVGRNEDIDYGEEFDVRIKIKANVDVEECDIKVSLYAPPFTTHGFSQNQRLLFLGLNSVSSKKIKAVAPPNAAIAPPGYYILFVSYKGVPSDGWWVHLE